MLPGLWFPGNPRFPASLVRLSFYAHSPLTADGKSSLFVIARKSGCIREEKKAQHRTVLFWACSNHFDSARSGHDSSVAKLHLVILVEMVQLRHDRVACRPRTVLSWKACLVWTWMKLVGFWDDLVLDDVL